MDQGIVERPVLDIAVHNTARLDLPLSGMSCAACVRRMERAASHVPGVESVTVNLATERASVTAGPAFRMPALAAALQDAGYPIALDTVDLAVTGMTCASCAGRVERALLAVPGVLSAAVNLATEQARVQKAAGLRPDALAAAVRAAGYGATLPGAPSQLDRAQASVDRDGRYAAAACVLALPLLLPMLLMPFGWDAALPGFVQLVLAGAVQGVFGAGFYRGAWHALRAGAGNMDLLVTLGTTAAFGLSVWQLANGHGEHLYFEASAAVIALVRVGKWLEDRARRQAGDAIRAMQRLSPERARVRRGGAEQDITTTELRPGDLMVVRPGERMPADGLVREGQGSADESLLTGESLPVPKQPSARIVGGSLNCEALLLVEATALGAESQLGRMVRLIEDAQAAKPPVQRLVDRVSAVFVPVVVGIAVLTLIGWWLAGAEVETSMVNAVAVLVIACPCALGLATPAAIMVGIGIGTAARHGILIRDPAALEQARAVTTVVFDTTGTLTEGRPTLVALHPAPGVTKAEVLRLAAMLQAGSEHPLARAVLAAYGPAPAASGTRAVPGRGVAGTIESRPLLLGNARMMEEAGVDTAPLTAEARALEAAGRTVSLLGETGLGKTGALLGLLAFGDALKPGAAPAVAALQAQGLRVVLLTGDNQGAADTVAQALGIETVHAMALPADQAALVASLRTHGAVAMVGDGVNDAAALAAADLGLAMATGADVAGAAAGITLMRGDPGLAPAALDIAGRTYSRIRQGLFWAFAYNVVGIPLAAAGLLSPVLAGAAMAFSSVGVVGSALLLRRWRLAGAQP